MDWSKAKTILIIVFIGVNILLSYFLFSTGNADVIEIPKERLEATISYLNKYNVYVKAEVLRKINNLNPIMVRMRAFKDTELSVLFPEKTYIERLDSEGIFELKQGDVTINVSNQKLLEYNNPNKQALGTIDKEAAYKLAKSFINKLGISMKECYVRSEATEAGSMHIVYGQLYKGLQLCDSYIDIIITDSGIYSASVIWFDEVRPVPSDGNIVTNVSALVKVYDYYKTKLTAEQAQGTAVEISKEKPLIVESIRQGYYTPVNGEDAVMETVAVPVWQIETNYHLLYVDAFGEHIVKITKNDGK